MMREYTPRELRPMDDRDSALVRAEEAEGRVRELQAALAQSRQDVMLARSALHVEQTRRVDK